MKRLGLLALFLCLSAPTVNAHNHESDSGDKTPKCQCSKECKESCEKGKSKDCDCKECGCQESQQCHKK